MKIMVILLLVITILGCTDKASTNTPSSEKQEAASTSPAPKAPEPVSSGVTLGVVSGTILETMDAAGYTYMRLQTSKGEIWAAVQKAIVKKGSEVTIVNAMPMDGFESKTLNRKFDHIVFGSLSTGTSMQADPSPLASGHPAPAEKQATMAAQHAALANASVDVGETKVEKAEGVDGKTVAEIFASKTSLADTLVAIRGKVVKYNSGIMGKNWIHLRDGSGSPEKKNHDLTVTTSDSAAVGDVVLVRGTVHLNRDFGSGYAYPVIIEDAKVLK
jgi:hypothetical protein